MFSLASLQTETPGLYRKLVTSDYTFAHFSQNGEEILLRSLLERYFAWKTKGYFVDLGCYHPVVFSNTFALHIAGWRGLNIDAEEKNIASFDAIRPKDLNVCSGVSDKKEELLFSQIGKIAQVGTGASSSFCPKHVEMMQKNFKLPIFEQKILPCRNVNELLDEYVPKGQAIDYMNIDLEGFDERVVKAIDWQRYRPNILSVEIHNVSLEGVISHPMTKTLHAAGMVAMSRAGDTVFFIDKSQANMD